MSLIAETKSVIVACDVRTLEDLEDLVAETTSVEGIGGYKIGAILTMNYSLPEVVNSVKEFSNKPVIFDHQKAGTDIPDLGEEFMRSVANAEVDAVIIFPFGGRETQKQWIKAAQDNDISVLVGGHMTQPEFLRQDGGFIAADSPSRMYKIGLNMGIRNFVVPGNDPKLVQKYRELLENQITDELTFYAPGFIKQGGVITETGKVAGNRWHAIVGSAIYTAEDRQKAARKITSQIT